MDNRVFIGWNGENRNIAERIKYKLDEYGYEATVGGDSDSSRSIGERVTKQMDVCDFALIIIEKIPLDGTDGKFKLNENVMYEWGYLNSRLNDPQKVRLFLINMTPNELPMDVIGAWATTVKKSQYSDEFERNSVFDSVADSISAQFINDIKDIKRKINKFEYLAKWESYRNEIYDHKGAKDISDIILYGLQAAIYFNEVQKLSDTLRNLHPAHSHEMAVISCAQAVLSVFTVSKRLSIIPKKKDIFPLIHALNSPYEESIKNDDDLRAWCKLFRLDKLELCYELMAQADPEFKDMHIKKAIEMSFSVIELLKERVAVNPADEYFAMLYFSYQYRNMAVLYSELCENDPDNHAKEQEIEYRKLTCEKRDALYQYYGRTFSRDDMMYDCLLQEYILALAEMHPYITDQYEKYTAQQTIDSLMDDWEEKINCKNFVFNAIKEKVKDLRIE